MDRSSQLAALIERHTGVDGVFDTALPRLSLIRCSRPLGPIYAMSRPMVSLVAQGARTTCLGDEHYNLDSQHHLLFTAELPVVGHVLEASPERPYLGLQLDIDPCSLAEVLASACLHTTLKSPLVLAMARNVSCRSLQEALVRLLQLLDHPRDMAVLAPLIEKEILYWVAMASPGQMLQQVCCPDSKLSHVNKVIQQILKGFRHPLNMERLAHKAGLPPSCMPKYFKAVTGLTPVQYQKQLRLREARRLIYCQALDMAHASKHVGYECDMAFHRDYARFFGVPPMRNHAEGRHMWVNTLGQA
ncbi:AraC family transcriptional regulator [Leeia aquatica]|uniref:AraC family transcriptional regulator n=1 Tax=Leeia aquatica TaxID=2725557 RepID=A0A847SA61_9NEIS|nr:AraC family transcriptional regulator [Leeia aquatica]NLR76623.1 AraC family transcriptional regulator [Leeia aquatica]